MKKGRQASGFYHPLRLIMPDLNQGTAKNREEVEQSTKVLIKIIYGFLVEMSGSKGARTLWRTRKGQTLSWETPQDLVRTLVEHGHEGYEHSAEFMVDVGEEGALGRYLVDLSEYFTRVMGQAAMQILRGGVGERIVWARELIMRS